MTRIRIANKIILVIGSLILVLFVLAFGFIVWIWKFGSESTVRQDTPITREEALKKYINVPEGASRIYYLTWAGGMQSLDGYMRCDLPPDADLPAVVKSLVDAQNVVMSQNSIYRTTRITNRVEWTIDPRFAPMPWWDLDEIRQGFYTTSGEMWGLDIWVDEDARRLYVHYND